MQELWIAGSSTAPTTHAETSRVDPAGTGEQDWSLSRLGEEVGQTLARSSSRRYKRAVWQALWTQNPLSAD